MIDRQDADNGAEPKGRGTVTQQAAAHGRKLKELYDRISPLILAVVAALSLVLSLLLQLLTGNSRIVSAVVSLTLVTVCLLIFKLGPFLRSEFARSVRAMWMPIAVTIVAGILLFYEGQGRDLGVGLLGEGQF
jgi:lipopolysaccharide export LptBFGC system permease protein LptF